jgi:hypothetical protein
VGPKPITERRGLRAAIRCAMLAAWPSGMRFLHAGYVFGHRVRGGCPAASIWASTSASGPVRLTRFCASCSKRFGRLARYVAPTAQPVDPFPPRQIVYHDQTLMLAIEINKIAEARISKMD